MTFLDVQLADSATNSIFSPIPGVTWLALSRASGSTPGSLEFYCSTGAATDVQSGSTPPRFNPKQQVRLNFTDYSSGTPTPFPVFAGRIDTAELVDAQDSDPSSQNHRQWHIVARDWLAILADTKIQTGKWRSAPLSPQRHLPFDFTDQWTGNYVENWTGTQPDTPGEYRYYIVMDLILNIINNTQQGFILDGHPTGIGFLGFLLLSTAVPNSKRIVRNLSTLTQTRILDAIRDLTRAEPWDTGQGSAEVDGYSIAAANFPFTAGFGAEVQIAPLNGTDAFGAPLPNIETGRIAEYYRHGGIFTDFVYEFPPVTGLPINSLILKESFSRQGMDVYSRVSPVGQGDATYGVTEPEDGGIGAKAPFMEQVWDPLNGNLMSRSEPLSYSNSIVGDYAYQQQGSTPEWEAILARDLQDAAYADLYAGAPALQNSRGGTNQGRIVVAGPPIDQVGGGAPIQHILRPGENISIHIPQIGIVNENNNTSFIIQTWRYVWPDDQTTFDLSRTPFASLGGQLVRQQSRINEALTASGKSYISNWQQVDPTGVMIFHHALGTKPSTVTLEAGYWDGSTRLPGNNAVPIPVANSIVTPPAAAFDAAQGQYLGYVVTTSNDTDVTISYAYWLSPSDAEGHWLTRTDPNVLLRVKVYP